VVVTILSTFVLVGTIISHDDFLSTIEFDLNPATNGGPSIAVLPNEAIPCDIKIGMKIYVVKNSSDDASMISCTHENKKKGKRNESI
jgi:hypothetical protein